FDRCATPGVGSTPTSTTDAPSDARPALRAAASSGPDRRVSRATSQRPAPMARAAARPSATASSGVSSVLATPRTPSVPNLRDTLWELPLGVLRSLPGLLEPVLLGLLLTRVAGEEAGHLEGRAHLLVE